MEKKRAKERKRKKNPKVSTRLPPHNENQSTIAVIDQTSTKNES